MLSFLNDWIERMAKSLAALACLCGLLMMIQVVADVGMKNLMKAPIPGATEVVAHYYMVALTFLPLALVEFQGKAIHVDLFYNMMSVPVRRACLVLAYVLQTGFYCALTWQSWIDSMAALDKGEFVEGLVDVVVWPGRFVLPVGFGLAALASLLRLAQVLTNHSAVAPLLSRTARDEALEDI